MKKRLSTICLLRAAVSFVLAVATGHSLMSAEFRGLGNLPGQQSSSAWDVSSDGRVVIGISDGTPQRRLFRWTPQTGMEDLGDAFSPRMSLSGDGSVIVWETKDSALLGAPRDSDLVQIVRWERARGINPIGYLSETYKESGFPHVSDDGNTVVGASLSHDIPGYGAGSEAFRWTEVQGMEPLGFGSDMGPEYGWARAGRAGSSAMGVSTDGNLIAGTTSAADVDGTNRRGVAWIWDDQMQARTPLPIPPEFNVIGIGDMSPDGSLVVGNAWLTDGLNDPDEHFNFLWQREQNQIRRLEFPDASRGFLRAVSGDGSRVVGHSSGGGGVAIWTETDSARWLEDVLREDYGLAAALEGWRLVRAEGMSADGQVIAGSGFNPEGKGEAWMAVLATVPEPASRCHMLTIVLLLILSRRKRANSHARREIPRVALSAAAR